ncbi:hypothetical protein GIB67_015920 [Kingdonia uniflora]|uniref:AB hydrolase-1 domain-containing protein n=1 Tax=Kingdonia uniflora TaxID=39325 RepID=A0A7J7PC69_9MAGN|nr:hypothetical protein GIB67_015920 [Kingdonia uniflora]
MRCSSKATSRATTYRGLFPTNDRFHGRIPPEDNKVILVGHSFGGICISMAMEKFPEKVRVGVFVTAYMPSPSITYQTIGQEHINRLVSQRDNNIIFGNGQDNPPTVFLFGKEFMTKTLATMLMRPIGMYHDESMLNEIKVSEERWGTVCRVYIMCDEDKVLSADFQRWFIEKNPPDEVKEIKCADHMVMFCKPLELFTSLKEIASSYT